jgi:cobaltochelatase CobT
MTEKSTIPPAIRALSGQDVEVSFVKSNNPDAQITGKTITLPEEENLQKSRAKADEVAAYLKYHQPHIHNHYRPANNSKAQIFDTLENLRTQILLSKKYAGVLENIHFNKNFGDEVADNIGKIFWQKGLGLPAANKTLLENWIEQNAPQHFENLQNNMEGQEAFAKAAITFIDKLIDNQNVDASSDPSQAADSEDSENNEGNKQNDNTEQDDVESSKAETPKTTQDKSTGEMTTGKTRLEEAGPNAGRLPNFELEPEFVYKVFTRQFDEVVHATSLASQQELGRLRAQLDQKIESLQTITSKLASRLQRLLLAQQKSWWELDKDEGLIDSKRLSRLVVDSGFENIYKQYKTSDFKDTVVTLLIDNSGSMRGRPIMSAVACADILSRVLEQCGVKVEVLGFTTAEWKGGKSRQLWQKQGAPKNPGRLNDLRHIIYKGADSPWRGARKNLALALKDGLLKENIDGEAIMWAAQRLSRRPEERKILMVISDGAPVDDSTISANPTNYLDNHLRQVIEHIEAGRRLELLAIGIGHDVGRYYKNAIKIMDISDLGETMITKMEELFAAAA